MAVRRTDLQGQTTSLGTTGPTVEVGTPPSLTIGEIQVHITASSKVNQHYHKGTKSDCFHCTTIFFCALPPCSLLYRGEGQVKYCRATLSVLSFYSFLSATPSLHLSSSPDLSLLMQSSHLTCGLPLFLRP